MAPQSMSATNLRITRLDAEGNPTGEPVVGFRIENGTLDVGTWTTDGDEIAWRDFAVMQPRTFEFAMQMSPFGAHVVKALLRAMRRRSIGCAPPAKRNKWHGYGKG